MNAAPAAKTDAVRHVWNSLPEDRPMPRITRRRIIGEKMMISEVRLEKGFDLESHAHPNEQFVVMLAGRCTFGIGEPGSKGYREVELKGGEVLELPGGVAHSCRALEDSHILDMFSPVSATTGVDRH